MGWDRPFDQPIPLPSGPPARTLRDAANYIKTLPKLEHDTPEWRLAVQMLIDAAEDRGPMLFAKMGIVRAVERHVERGRGRQLETAYFGGCNSSGLAHLSKCIAVSACSTFLSSISRSGPGGKIAACFRTSLAHATIRS